MTELSEGEEVRGDWIPACAGMTERGVGMRGWVDGGRGKRGGLLPLDPSTGPSTSSGQAQGEREMRSG